MDKPILEIEDIKRILPQRYPFLMIDRVILLEKDKIVALKNVSVNENYFQGHFPEEKIMPGVLIIEAIAQAGIVLVDNIAKSDKRRIYFLGAVSKSRFFKPVIPGDQLRIEVKLIKFISNIGIIYGEVLVKDKKVAQAEISFSVKER